MPIRKIKNWLKKYEKYFFYYKDGFFVLPYLNDSPKLLVESFVNMPFVSHDKAQRIAVSNNPFTNADFRYDEIENDLWIMFTEVDFKVNVQTKAIYSNKKSDYYYLIFTNYQNNLGHEMRINDSIIPNKSWVLYQPNTQIDGFHSKGTKGLVFDFAFSEKWLEENILGENSPYVALFNDPLVSEKGYIVLNIPEAEILINEVWQCLSRKEGVFNSKLQLKIYTHQVLNIFFSKLIRQNQSSAFNSISEKDREALKKVENYLKENLKTGFPGIDFLSDLVNTSPTKLKVDFKLMYGKTIFQFFKEKQMELAFQMLKCSDTQIKNIATTFGYENTSKFASSFKKYHKILPSQLRN